MKLQVSPSLLGFAHKHEHIVQFIRYVAIGGIMLLLNLFLIWGFVEVLGYNYLLASSVAFVFESLLAFFANRKWTFRTDTDFKKGYLRFITVAFYSFLIVLFITYGMIHYLALQYVWARTFSTVITGFIGYFLDMKLTFRV